MQVRRFEITPDPRLKPLHLAYPAPVRYLKLPAYTNYFIDSRRGSDQWSGTAPDHPWRTFARLNSAYLSQGDDVMLRAGSTWIGYLSPSGSGTLKSPIVIQSYGAGPEPKIDAACTSLATLYLYNASYITVKDIDIANRGTGPQPKLTGVEVMEANSGVAHDVVLDRLDVHDVTGSDLKTEGGGAGIDCTCVGDRVPTYFDGLTIENCLVRHTDRNGITMSGEWTRDHWYPSRHVLISHNFLSDIGGDGIVPVACDGAVIDHNTLTGARLRTPDFAAGIWPWSCDNTIIQYNEVSRVHGTNDGQGFDSDWNCRDSVFQYNYSHNNDGGFMLICDDGTTPLPYNIGNSGTVIRYNVSIDDGRYTFDMAGPLDHAKIYNNTIVAGPGAAGRIVESGSWGGFPRSAWFENNLFYARHSADFDLNDLSSVRFERNAYCGRFANRPSDTLAVLQKPHVLNPNSTEPGGYAPRAGSPLFDAGVVIMSNGGRDFAGHAVPSHLPPTIGAFQR